MRPRLAVLIATVFASSALHAEEQAPISEKTEDRILEGLPAYDKEASEEARKAAEKTAPDEDVVVLPEMTVIERQQQRMAEEDLFKKGLKDEQLVKRELSDLDRSFIPPRSVPWRRA
jgi:hypothetical protein